MMGMYWSKLLYISAGKQYFLAFDRATDLAYGCEILLGHPVELTSTCTWKTNNNAGHLVLVNDTEW